MTGEDFRNYIAAFNRSDFDAFGQHYAPDIHFQGRAGEFHSRAEVVSFYRQVRTSLRETIRILSLVIGPQDIVAELETELHALEDWPDLPSGPLPRGETRRSQNFLWYEVANGMFSRIRAAHYRSLPGASDNDTAVRIEPTRPEPARAQSAGANPTCPPSQSAMSAEHFSAYIDAFNRDDIATYGDYYDENVVLILAGKTELRGRQAIFDFYKVVKAQTRRTLQINKFLSTPNHLAVELESEFLALQDLPEFTAGPMRKGERIFINTLVLYDLLDGKFSRIRSAQFRKIVRP